MRRSMRRRAVPYKSPRLFSMVALLVCLVLMMNSLRSMRGPGPNAERIISNLDNSIKLVGTAGKPPTDFQASTEPAASADQPTTPTPSTSDQDTLDPVLGTSQQTPTGESNLVDAPNLNLREDLVLQDWLGLVQDNALTMQKLEMPAYWRIMTVVKNTPFSDLLKAADSKVRFNDLYSSPAKQRSKLFTLTVNIRKVTRYETEENSAGVEELFEVWCSQPTMTFLYVFVTPELPPGLDANTSVNRTAKFAGYFFKNQGYHPAMAKLNAKPALAPMLIGKFELAKAEQGIATKTISKLELIVGAIILIVGLAAILLRIFVFSAKKPKLRRVAPKINFDMYTDRSTDSTGNIDSRAGSAQE